MSFKLKALVGLTTLAVAGSIASLTVPAANAETEHCGYYCATMASESFGATNVAAVSGNNSVLLAPGFNSHEDFVGVPLGTAKELVQIHEVPAAMAATYGDSVVYELAYLPFGKIGNQCLGVSGTTSGSAVQLATCGSSGTLWIGVHRDHSGNFEPFVNVTASTSSAKVLTATSATGKLTIGSMSISGGVVAPSQMWESLIGIFGKTVPWPVPGGQGF